MAAVWGRRLLGAALLSFLVVAVLDAVFGQDVTLLHRLYDEDERREAQAAFDPRDDVSELYGLAEPPLRIRVIVFDRDRLIAPAEAPDRRFLFVDRAAGASVLPVRTLWWRVAWVVGPLVLLGAVLRARGRRHRPRA